MWSLRWPWGSGHVRCAHGLLPVPAPATAYLLRGVPVYGGGINGELCTPTGAALLTEFADSFGPLPEMTLEAVGCGLGTKEFPKANCLRALAGTAAPVRDSVTELLCTVDDMTAEDLAHAVERLLEAGALDVHTVAVTMKKGRPGTQLRLLCRPDRAEEMAALLFRHTTTLGVPGPGHAPVCAPAPGRDRGTPPSGRSAGSSPRATASAGKSGSTRIWPEIAREQGLGLPEVRAALDAALPDDLNTKKEMGQRPSPFLTILYYFLAVLAFFLASQWVTQTEQAMSPVTLRQVRPMSKRRSTRRSGRCRPRGY